MKYKLRPLFTLAILLFAAWIRLNNLSHLPISLFGDEVDVGYHAWSLATTLRDYRGHLLPTYIQSLAEWRAPLLMYVTAPFVGILGPSPFSVRLPVALLGIFNIYLIYLLTNKLFRPDSHSDPKDVYKPNLGHLVALILAITPWHIHYSRAAFESTLLLSELLLGTYLFLKSKQKPLLLYLSPLPFLLSLYTYSTANVFSPLLFLSLLLIYRPKIDIRKLLPFGAVYFVILAPIAYQILAGPAAGRFQGISIFSDPKVTESVVLERTAFWAKNDLITKLIHNRPVAYFSIIGSQYLTAFSPQFLFLNGDPNFRQSISRFGELLWVTVPFLLFGIVFAISKLTGPTSNDRRPMSLLLVWLALAPIPSALTQGGGDHATRLFIMLPPLVILSGLGINFFYSRLKSKILIKVFLIVLTFALIANFVSYWHRYSTEYLYESAKNWHYGYQDIMTKLSKFLTQTQKVFINNTYEPSLLRFAFFTKYPPKEFQKNFIDDTVKSNVIKGFDGFVFAKEYYFGQARNLDDLQKLILPGDIYLAVQGIEIPGDWDWSKNPPKGFSVIGQTRDVFGNPLFVLVRRDE